ncbi:FAD:protein FMN transferase [Hydrogenimonas thermophila]|uniref:FAD:protein FMN transferase n=1 Tax=Hydrogenimonas thermophila TaxID=223786 RepID=UPI00293726B3|nr:FAD:protein FMN transferase [Hydrogenimonas thermophila]WOE70778.1 FAD:protein FMN transferase [Hydrogenimonas thermophila]WOE73296.1 FAD:protein FMN transferase [Hydrogenimonas thermophila]
MSADTIRRERVLMGTYAFVIVDANDSQIVNTIFARMKQVEESLSSFLKEGGVLKLNRKRKGKVDDDLFEAINLCKKLYSETNGYFDCTIGSITKQQFGFGTENEKIPSSASIAQSKVGMDGVHMHNRNVWLEDDIYLDLGGMGKGFGVDKAADILKRAGITQAIVGLSGDIRCFGSCSIAIQNPFDEGAVGEINIAMQETGISTSGIYRRFVKTKDYNHLIDPKRRRSERLFASVTLVAPLPNVLLDGWATAISVMPASLALKFLDAHPSVEYLLIGTNGVVLKKGRNIRYTAHSLSGFILHPSLSLKEKSKWLQKLL